MAATVNRISGDIMCRTLVWAVLGLSLSLPAGAASLSPDLQQRLTTLNAEETIQVMITFIGGRPKATTLQDLMNHTPQLFKMQGGRVIGAVATAEQVSGIANIREVRTIELAR